MITLDTVGHFLWNFSDKFLIETTEGNYEWSDPEYNGDNTIVPALSYGEWLDKLGILYARDKGHHKIRDYCGEEVKIII